MQEKNSIIGGIYCKFKIGELSISGIAWIHEGTICLRTWKQRKETRSICAFMKEAYEREAKLTSENEGLKSDIEKLKL